MMNRPERSEIIILLTHHYDAFLSIMVKYQLHKYKITPRGLSFSLDDLKIGNEKGALFPTILMLLGLKHEAY